MLTIEIQVSKLYNYIKSIFDCLVLTFSVRNNILNHKNAFSQFIFPEFHLNWSDQIKKKEYYEQSLIQTDTKDSSTTIVKKFGVGCVRVINPEGGAPWLYVKVPESAAGIGRSILVEVSIFTNSDSQVWVEYDSTDNKVRVLKDEPGAFKPTESEKITSNNSFEDVSFYIPDIHFSNRINGSDLRIVADVPNGEPMYISKVIVKRAYKSKSHATLDARKFYAKQCRHLQFKKHNRPECSIIIPVYNKFEYTVQCLKYLKENTIASYEVIVVDDCSDREDMEMLGQIEGLTIIQNKEPLGFAKSCNRGAGLASTEYLLFLNNDTIPMKHWLAPMLDIMRKDKEVGIVGSKLLYPGTKTIQHAGVAFNQHGLPVHIHKSKQGRDPEVTRDYYVNAVTGASLMTRKSLFERIGGFDESFQNGYEDIDYCLRSGENGYLTWYCANSQLYHYESISEGRINYTQEVHNRNYFQNRWLADSPRSTMNIDRFPKVDSDNIQVPKVIAFYSPICQSLDKNYSTSSIWEQIRATEKLYSSHYQPRIPGELGRYQQSDVKILSQQAQMASEFGIYGFCYYWTEGLDLSEQPLRKAFVDDKVNFPFCLCLTNASTIFQAEDKNDDLGVEREPKVKSSDALIGEVATILLDSRYIRINDKPLLLIYRPDAFENAFAASQSWRQLCINYGIGEIVLGFCCTFENARQLPEGFDIAIEMPPQTASVPPINRQIRSVAKDFKGSIHDYYEYMVKLLNEPKWSYPRYRTAMLAWDETPTHGSHTRIFHGFTPQIYEYWLSTLIDTAFENATPFEPLVFINAWNDWKSGSYLEPDKEYGRQNLEATKKAIDRLRSGETPSILQQSRLRHINWRKGYTTQIAKFNPKVDQVESKLAKQRHEAESTMIQAISYGMLSERTAVIVHVYYIDVFQEIIELIATIKSVPITVFITTTKELELAVKKRLGKRKIKDFRINVFENRGRDVLPFIKILPEVIDLGFSYIVKVHTKKSLHRQDGARWRQELYGALLNDNALSTGIHQLITNPQIGIIGPDKHLVNIRTNMLHNFGRIQGYAKKLNLDEQDWVKASFIAGTMFLARTSAFKPVLKLEIKEIDFEDENGQVDGTFAHCLERLFALSSLSTHLEVTSFYRLLSKL